MKLRALISLLISAIFSCNESKVSETEQTDIIQVEYPETSELANIILALTEYGKTDNWEVRQGFDCYNKVQEYFKPVSWVMNGSDIELDT